MLRKRILIVSPASARENNGNWQTASRWARFLRSRHHVAIAPDWDAGTRAPDLLIALHARRSAAPLAAYAVAYPERARILVLTGTDLYRDIATVPAAQASLEHATSLVLLQPAGLGLLAPRHQAKACVIYQSAPTLRAHQASAQARHRDICMIGHLREEKDPLTFMRAASLLQPLPTTPRLRLLHIGAALDADLGAAALRTAAAHPHYQWLGALPHAATRQRLKRCHAMVLASNMEGGANVLIEALTCGVPVLASDINGNRGMLGEQYTGYFPPGDAPALARLIERSVSDPVFYAGLRQQCQMRAVLFSPRTERDAVLDLVDNQKNLTAT